MSANKPEVLKPSAEAVNSLRQEHGISMQEACRRAQGAMIDRVLRSDLPLDIQSVLITLIAGRAGS